MESFKMRKYPRTPHLEGSRLQPGDEDLSQIKFEEIANKHLVIEEKIDGANSAISFSENGELMLQSRGHYLTGGYRERHYNLMKQWANIHRNKFWEVLGTKYIMFGEWMYAKHAVYYDMLPSYFMEFDIFDSEKGIYLSTEERKKITSQLPICSVPVLAQGKFKNLKQVLSYLGPSKYISENYLENLKETLNKLNIDETEVLNQTQKSTTMEGLYIKVEENGEVVFRVKFVRASFTQTQLMSDDNWLNKAIIPNKLDGSLDDMFNMNY